MARQTAASAASAVRVHDGLAGTALAFCRVFFPLLETDMHTVAANHEGAMPGPVARLTMLVALAALLNASWRRCRETHQRRLAERPTTQSEKLQVWEDEGGQNQMPEATR